MRVCVWVCACTQVHTDRRRGHQRPCIIALHLETQSLETGSLAEPRARLVETASSSDPSVTTPHIAGVTSMHGQAQLPPLNRGSGNLNMGPQAYTAGTLICPALLQLPAPGLPPTLLSIVQEGHSREVWPLCYRWSSNIRLLCW